MERKILKKKILGIFCTLCLCICMMSGSTVVYGAGVDSCVDRIAEGRYANISMYHTNLMKSGSTFTAYASVYAKVKASISITMTLQRQSGTSWSDVTSWFDSATGSGLELSKNYVAGTRGNYRVRAVYTVNGETITTDRSTVPYKHKREKVISRYKNEQKIREKSTRGMSNIYIDGKIGISEDEK